MDSQSDLVDAQWYRNDVLIEGLQRHQNFRDVGTNLTIGLEIFDIMKADSGTIYHCTPNGQPQISSRRASIVVAGTCYTCYVSTVYVHTCIYIYIHVCVDTVGTHVLTTIHMFTCSHFFNLQIRFHSHISAPVLRSRLLIFTGRYRLQYKRP